MPTSGKSDHESAADDEHRRRTRRYLVCFAEHMDGRRDIGDQG